jgi:hypothetical protein
MRPPSDRSKKNHKAKSSLDGDAPSSPSAPANGVTDSESTSSAKRSDELPPLPGMKGYSRPRASLAPPAPPVSEAPPPPTTHEIFDVESADADIVRNAMARRAALRASARPHPPKRSQAPGATNVTPTGAVNAETTADADPVQRLSTPLSWTAAKDPTPSGSANADLADAVEDEISDEFLEPVVDSAPLALPPIPHGSAEPLASAIPTGSVVVPPPSARSNERWGKRSVIALLAAGLVAVGSFVAWSGKSGDETRAPATENQPESAAALENPTSEANPALRVPLPPLELDIGVPVSPPSESTEADPSSLPPVAPSGVLPTLPRKAELQPFDEHAANAALRAAAAGSLACHKPGDPSGIATVIVRYAPSGRVTSATVEAGPFAGTVTGGCVATLFRKALIPPFSGDYVTVKKTVALK